MARKIVINETDLTETVINDTIEYVVTSNVSFDGSSVIEKPLVYVDSVLKTAENLVVTGKVMLGKIKVNDTMYNYQKASSFEILGLKVNGNAVDEANKNDIVTLLLDKALLEADFKESTLLFKEDLFHEKTKFSFRGRVLTEEQGGFNAPFASGFTFTTSILGKEIDCKVVSIIDPKTNEILSSAYPGESYLFIVELQEPYIVIEDLYLNFKFNSQTIVTGTVFLILE